MKRIPPALPLLEHPLEAAIKPPSVPPSASCNLKYRITAETSPLVSGPLELRSLFQEAEDLDCVLDSAELRNHAHPEADVDACVS